MDSQRWAFCLKFYCGQDNPAECHKQKETKQPTKCHAVCPVGFHSDSQNWLSRLLCHDGVYYSTNEYPWHVNLCLLWLQIRWCSLGDALLTWGWPTVWLGCLGLCRTPWVIEFIMLIVPVVLIKMVWSVCSSGLVVVVGLRWVVIRTAVSVLGYRSSIADVRWGWRRVIVKKMWRGGQTITLSTCDLEGGSLGCVA